MKIVPEKLEFSVIQAKAACRRLCGQKDIFGKLYSRKIHLSKIRTDHGIVLHNNKRESAIERTWLIAWQKGKRYSLTECRMISNKLELADFLKSFHYAECENPDEAKSLLAEFSAQLGTDEGWGLSSKQLHG
ncbi:MAG: hypothetical protein Q7Q71_07805 [Verrucomicrobiota bacterium JB023]|nr:hypothetical protein [Verrucomicrobiota bacterium JB023]